MRPQPTRPDPGIPEKKGVQPPGIQRPSYYAIAVYKTRFGYRADATAYYVDLEGNSRRSLLEPPEFWRFTQSRAVKAAKRYVHNQRRAAAEPIKRLTI